MEIFASTFSLLNKAVVTISSQVYHGLITYRNIQKLTLRCKISRRKKKKQEAVEPQDLAQLVESLPNIHGAHHSISIPGIKSLSV